MGIAMTLFLTQILLISSIPSKEVASFKVSARLVGIKGWYGEVQLMLTIGVPTLFRDVFAPGMAFLFSESDLTVRTIKTIPDLP